MWSTYLRNKVLDKVLRNTNFTSATYISLHTASPGTTGANEVSDGGYSRQLHATTSWDAASSAAAESNVAMTFASMPTTTVTHWGAWDAASGGNFLFGGALSSSVPVTSGDGFAIPAGATLTLEAGSS